MRRSTILALSAGLLLCASDAMAQRGPGRRGGGENARQAGGQDRGGARENQEQIKPYDEVITEEAKTTSGLFTVHRIDDKVFYEIPANAFGKDMLWVTQIEQTQAGFGYGGTSVGDLVVRWELRDEKVLLRDIKYTIRSSDENDAVTKAVEATSVNPIIQVFDVQAWGKDKAPVIEVTSLFTGDVDQFSPSRQLNASGVDAGRTFLEEIKSFPQNIETKVLKTFRVSPQTGATQGRRGGRGGSNQSSVTALMHYSMVVLPEEPMQPREYDDRVGFFTERFQDFGTGEHEVETVRYITRWRLEKQDAAAEVSDPVKPIVFHVGRGVPDKWRPYVHQGIEMWQPAFEAAGFSNAIIAKDAPSERDDPDWDAEDARYSSIRWLPSTTENAMGPHVHDPRTGEILESDIIMYHNVLKLCRDWYFVQASPSDERAQTLPMPDDLLGDLLAYVVAHEVGHTLGFPHNMKASSSYSVEQLRDPEFTAKHGTEASIMDYGRFNYIAQPGDGATLIPKIGPYDFFAIEWGYRQFDVDSPEEEKEALAAIVAKQKDNHMLLFGDPDGVDPGAQTEDLSGEPILATQLGLQNIDRVLGYLVQATCKEGENYDLLQNMYDQVVSQRNRELNHVTTVVAGVNKRNFWYGDADRLYHPVSPDQQRQAVQFLLNNAFTTPESLIDQSILARLEANGAADRILSGQQRILRTLLSENRIERMAELVEQNDGEGYLPIQMLEELRTGIWNDLEGYPIEIDLYRRNLHRAYVDILADAMKTESPTTDLPALSRDQLEKIHAAILACEEKEKDATSAAHLKDLAERIKQMLEGTFMPASAEPAATGGGRFGGG